MIYNYYEIIEKCGNDYNLNKALKSKEIIKIENGLYSDEPSYKKINFFIKKYKNPIFTMESAFYYYGISDVIPDKYYIASNKNGSKYNDSSIKQYFMSEDLVNIGVSTCDFSGTSIRIYNKERLLIEVIRYKNSLPYDYYKEIINYYRKKIDEINIQLVIDMLTHFPKKEMIQKILREEVL